jgi:hypothetical protein
MAQILKDATIAKTETRRLTAEIFGSGGHRTIVINLDGEYADKLDEFLDVWYHDFDKTKSLTKQPQPIGATPEEALEWWVRSRRFVFAEGE